MNKLPILFFSLALLLAACTDQPATSSSEQPETASTSRIPVIIDSDANNELDDQHAIAYLLFNGDIFDVKGITVNRTDNGGDVRTHHEEAGHRAERVDPEATRRRPGGIEPPTCQPTPVIVAGDVSLAISGERTG